MRYWIVVTTALLFFIWVLPLGIFFKPFQEESACGGQRAICLCSHNPSKTPTTPIEGHGFKNNSSTKEANGASGGGHSYIAMDISLKSVLTVLALNRSKVFAYQNPLLKSIEHIPKV